MSRTRKTSSNESATPKTENSLIVPKNVQECNEDYRALFEGPENDVVEASFYSTTKAFGAKYHGTAHILAKIHRYQVFFHNVWSEYGDTGDQISAIGKAYEFQQKCSTDPLVLDLADLLGTGDYNGVRQIAQIFEDYERNFPRLRGEEAKAKLFVMVACESLREIGYERSHVSKADIRHLADHMRAVRSLRSQKRVKNSTKILRVFKVEPERIEREIKELKLEKSAWTRIFKDLGLSDLTPGKAGRRSRKEEHEVLWYW